LTWALGLALPKTKELLLIENSRFFKWREMIIPLKMPLAGLPLDVSDYQGNMAIKNIICLT